MAYINEQLDRLNKVKKQENKNKKKNKRVLVAILASVFTLAVGVGAFFLIRNAINTVKITQSSNIAGEEGLTIVSQRGNEITLKAKDLNGYRFIGWNVGEEQVSDQQEYTFTIDDNTPNNYTAMYAKEYNVTVDEEIEHGTIELDKPLAIEGEEVTITATPEEYYILKELECKQTDQTEVEIIENKFIMPGSEVRVSAEFEKVDFNISLPEVQEGYTIKTPYGTPFTATGIKANSNLSFRVELDAAYTQSNIVVKNYDVVLTPRNGVYTINNVIADVNIIVENVCKNTYTITLPEQVGFSLKNSDNTAFTTTSVEYGDSISFKFELDVAYSQSQVAVKCNGQALELVEGLYTVSNITRNINITVEGVIKTTYTVTLPATQTGYALMNVTETANFGTTSVEYGDSISFKVVLAPAYSQSIIFVSCNEIELEPIEGVYTVSNITENIEITVEGVEKTLCEINVPQEQIGYSIVNPNGTAFTTRSKQYGLSISFKVVISDVAYSQSVAVVKNNGETLTAENDVYTIEVTEDVNITVEGVSKNTYSVTLPTEQVGYTLKRTNNTTFNPTSAEYGDNLTFKVVVDAGYSASVGNLVVKCNGNTLVPNNNTYTVANVTENVAIAISGLEINSYTITIPDEVIAKKNGTALTSGDTVYHYDVIVLSPATEPADGYFAVYSVTGAKKVAGLNTYSVKGNVTIEYDVEEGAKNASEYSTLIFKNYSNSEPYTVQVAANPDNKPTGNLVIPSRVKNNGKEYAVTIIASNGFKGCTELTSVTIPSTMKEVYRNGFDGCSNLQTVTFKNCTELTFLSNDSFKDCTSLTSITIPASVTAMGQIKDNTDGRGKIFNGCTNLVTLDFEDDAQYANMDVFENTTWLKNVTIPSGVGTLDTTFQYNTALESVRIQSGIASIDSSAFYGCTSLASIAVDTGNTVYDSRNNCNAIIETVTKKLIIGCKNTIIPNTVTSIGDNAFSGCTGLTEITIPSSVTNIGSDAFSGCTGLNKVATPNLEDWLNISFDNALANPAYLAHKLYINENELTGELVIPDDVTIINDYAFAGLTSLTSVKFGKDSTLETVGTGVFTGCTNLTSAIIDCSDNEVCKFVQDAVANYVKTIYILDESYTTDTTWLVNTIEFEKSVDKVEIDGNQYYEFKQNRLVYHNYTTATIDGVSTNVVSVKARNTTISGAIVIPETIIKDGVEYRVYKMETGAFSGCSNITSVSIPNTIISIGRYAFGYCTSLTSIAIPSSVKEIYEFSFDGSRINRVYTPSLEDWLNISFRDSVSNNDYGYTSNPLYYAHNLYIGENLVTSVTIPDTYTSINGYVFHGCTSLKSVTIPSSVTTIGDYAFGGTGLTSVTIPSSVIRIGESFRGCKSLTSITFADAANSQLKVIGEGAFDECSKLTGSITIPSSVTTIGGWAFCETRITSITFNNTSALSLGENVFTSCNYLSKVVATSLESWLKISFTPYRNSSSDSYIGNSNPLTLTHRLYIGENVLTEVVVPDTITRINAYAFYSCSNITSVTIPSSVTYIGNGAFYGCSGIVSMTLPFIGSSATATSASTSTLLGYIFGKSNYSGSTSVTQYYGTYNSITYYIPSALRTVTVTGGRLLYGAFSNCTMLTSIVLGDAISDINAHAFDGCTCFEGTTYGNATYIARDDNNYAILYKIISTDITEVTIHPDCEIISTNAFQDCLGLTEITIPSSVISIGQYVFDGCTNLATITFAENSQLTSIGDYTFSGCSGLTSITIPSGVTSIGNSAFSGCTGLTSVTFTENSQLTSIGNSAFNGCTGLTEITIPSSVTSIGSNAFNGCTGLTEITIPSSIASIGGSAFSGCTGLTSVTLTENSQLTSIGNNAFKDCTGLIKVTVSSIEDWLKISFGDNYDSNPLYYAKHLYIGENEVTELVIPNTITSISKNAFYNCESFTSVTFEENSQLTSIGTYAFYNCTGLTKVVVLSIEDWLKISFNGNSYANPLYYAKCLYIGEDELTDLIIPNTVTAINSYAFEYCTSLTSITIPSSVTSIGERAFYNCTELTSIILGENSQITKISNYAFGNCTGLTKVVVSSIEDWLKISFEGQGSYYTTINNNPLRYAGHLYLGENEVTNLVIPNTITSIKAYAFSDCTGLTSVTFTDNSQLTSIGASAFSGCTGLTEITIPSSVTSIGGNAFSRCSKLANVTFEENSQLTSIGTYAFYNCALLTSITIPSSVTSIGTYAFEGCYVLAEVYNLSSLNITKGAATYGYVAYYAQAVYTSLDIESKLETINGVIYYKESVNSYIAIALADKTLTEVKLSTKTTKIDNNAFSGCTALTSIRIPSSVTRIGDNAFYGCSGLTSIRIPSSVISIGSNAFYATGLTEITILSSATSIGSNAFSSCAGLTKVVISSIEDWLKISFSNSYSNPLCYANHLYIGEDEVTELVVPNTVVSINAYAFYNCNALTSVTFAENSQLISIGNYAFQNCTGLTSISIPSSVTNIGEGVFAGCSSLERITLPFVGGSVKASSDTYQYPFGYIFGSSSYNGGRGVGQYYYGSSTSSTDWTYNYIPSSLREVIITGGNILYGAFYNCSMLTNITLPNNITSIGNNAFYNCNKLTSITIPSSVNSIGNNAFYNCSGLTSVTFGENSQLKSIGNSAFYECKSLTSIIIPSRVTSIGNSAFYYCSNLYEVYNLSNLSITAGDSSYGYVAYYALAVYTSLDQESKVETINGVVYYKENENSYIAKAFIDKTLTEVILSEKTTKIDDKAFYNCSGLTSITIPSSVNSIGNNAFYNCSGLTSITIPSSVTSIGNYAFYYCYKLTSVTIAENSQLTSIANNAFYNCYGLTKVVVSSLADWLKISFTDYQSNPLTQAKHLYVGENEVTEVVIPNTVTSIGNYTFYNCTGLTSIAFAENSQLESIGDYAFYNCSKLTSIVIPSSVTSIGNSAFNSCNKLYEVYNLSELDIQKGTTSYGYVAYCAKDVYTSLDTESNLETINGVIYYKESADSYIAIALADNALTEVALSEKTTKIDNRAFYDCSAMTSITIPSSVTSIDYNAFYGCSGLTKVVVSSLENWLKITFNGYTSNPLCYSQHLYIGENEISGEVVIPNTVTSIPEYAFYNCSLITSITIPSGVTSIGDSAFYNCSELTSITIPSSVTSIGNNAFYGCTGLTKVVVSSIEDWLKITFNNSSSNPLIQAKHLYIGENEVTELVIPNTVTSINNYIFAGLTSLTSITIPSSVISIGYYAFSNCTGLTKVVASSLEDWLKISFGNETANPLYYAKHLYIGEDEISGEVVIPNTITSIPEYAFSGCSLITSITIPSSVTSIGEGAFAGCSSLVSMTIPFVGSEARNANDYSYGQYDALFGYIFGTESYTGGTSVHQEYYDDDGYYYSSDTFYIPSKLRSVTILGGDILSGAFYNCSMLTSVTFGSGVKRIRNYAFYNCTGLTSIEIPSNVSSIKTEAFSGCTNLKTVTIKNKTVYGNANSAYDDIGGLLGNVRVVRVLASVVESVTDYDKATYLNNSYAFTKSEKTTIDGKEYYIFTKR